MIHIPSYSFIDKNKEYLITILEKYSKENTRNNNNLSRVVNDTDNINRFTTIMIYNYNDLQL